MMAISDQKMQRLSAPPRCLINANCINFGKHLRLGRLMMLFDVEDGPEEAIVDKRFDG